MQSCHLPLRVWLQALLAIHAADNTSTSVTSPTHTLSAFATPPAPPPPSLQKPEAKDAYWQTHGAKDSSNGRNGGAHFDYLESLLASNGGGAGFFVGSGLTAADLCVWEILDLHMRLFKDQVEATVSDTRGGRRVTHRDAVVGGHICSAAQDMRTLPGRTDRVDRRSVQHAAAAPRHFCDTSRMHCTPNHSLVLLIGAVCVPYASCVLTPLSRAVPPAEWLLQACCGAAWHQGVSGLTPALREGQRKRHGLRDTEVCHHLHLIGRLQHCPANEHAEAAAQAVSFWL